MTTDLTYLREKPWLRLYSETTPKEIKVPNIPLFSLIDEACERYQENVAIIFQNRKITYSQLGNLIDRFAFALHELGTRKGDRIALYLPNCPQFIVSYYAVQKIGGIPVPISPLFTSREVNVLLKDSGAKIVVVLDVLFERLEDKSFESKPEIAIVTNIAEFFPLAARSFGKILRKIPYSKIPKVPNIYFFRELLQNRENPPKMYIDPKDTIATLCYTSGITGSPKGVMLTHRNLVANTKQVIAYAHDIFDYGKEVVAQFLPLFHTYGQMIMNLGLSTGQALVVFPRFTLKEILKAIKKHEITVFFGVPAVYNMIVHYPKIQTYDLSSLRLCICGTDVLLPEIRRRFKEITGLEIYEGYGLTEASPVTHNNPFKRKVKPMALGLPMPNTVAAIADPEKNQFLPIGKIGEIVIKGPQVMKGYWNNPLETKLVLTRINGEIWLRTGDLGRMDDEGYFYFTQRKKDTIKYKGYSIYPKEIEKELTKHPAVKEAAAIGTPDPVVGERVKAFVVLHTEQKETTLEEDIILWCKERLASYKVPKTIEFVDELPKNILGKILRKNLREKQLP
jgi:long-chain acyl-CoA synthetase